MTAEETLIADIKYIRETIKSVDQKGDIFFQDFIYRAKQHKALIKDFPHSNNGVKNVEKANKKIAELLQILDEISSCENTITNPNRRLYLYLKNTSVKIKAGKRKTIEAASEVLKEDMEREYKITPTFWKEHLLPIFTKYIKT